MIRITKILYPTDFSSYSNQAYFHAIALAESHKASLTIVYVYSPPQASAKAAGPDPGEAAYWQDQLEQIRPTNPDIAVNHVFLQGDPATRIIDHATEAGINLIVMGTHGRTGLERLLLGSVAEKVMREAPCSVLVVKLPKRSAAEKGEMAVAAGPA